LGQVGQLGFHDPSLQAASDLRKLAMQTPRGRTTVCVRLCVWFLSLFSLNRAILQGLYTVRAADPESDI
jgi:hypothetical protein